MLAWESISVLETQKSLFSMLETDIIIFFNKCFFGYLPNTLTASDKGCRGAPAPSQYFFRRLLIMALSLTAAEATS